MLAAPKTNHHFKKTTLFALALASFSSTGWAIYPDVDSMLQAARPTFSCPQSGSEFCNLYIDLDQLVPLPEQRYDALQTLIPSADGSLRAASDGTMRLVVEVINDRLMRVRPKESTSSGYSSGDEQPSTALSKPATLPISKPATTSTGKSPTTTLTPIPVVGKANPQDKPVNADGSPQNNQDPKDLLEEKIKSAKDHASQDKDKEKDKQVDNRNSSEKEKPAADGKANSTAVVGGTPAANSTVVVGTPAATSTPAAAGTVVVESTTAVVDKDDAANNKSTEEVKVKVDDRDPDKGVWIQVLGSEIGQNNRNWVPGYDAEVLGAVIGRDLLINPNFTMGLAGGYQHAHVTSRGPSGSYLDIKRFQGTLYAGYNFVCPYYLHGALTAAKNDYDSNRKILVPDIVDSHPYVNIVHADFSAWEVDAYFEFGYVWQCNHLRAIPKLVAMYSHFDVGAYYEEDAYGAFGLDMQVKYQHMDSLPLGVGAKLEYINEFENAYIVPEIHAYVFYDFINDKQTAVASMLGGGFPFYSQGAKPAPASIEIGAALVVHSYQNIVVDFQYDFVARTDYQRNSAFIKLRYEWA